MVLDRALATAGYENQFLDAGINRLLRRILDQRLVHEREHFLGIGLGCRQKPGARPGNRKYRLPDFLSMSVIPCWQYSVSVFPDPVIDIIITHDVILPEIAA